MNLSDGLFTTSTCQTWETPKYIFDHLNKEFHFTLDPCATVDNTKCNKYYTEEQNGLEQEWFDETVFVNPPYKYAKDWVKKWVDETNFGVTSVFLIPARTDTVLWHKYCSRASNVRFIKGRITFGGSTSGAPFPSAVVVFRPGCYIPKVSFITIPKP